MILLAGTAIFSGCPAGEEEPPAVPETAQPVSSAQQQQAQPPAGTYSVLAIAAVEARGDVLHVSGTTDLPDGAELEVHLGAVERPGLEPDAGVDGNCTVTDGKYEVELAVPQEGFAEGQCEVTVIFSPVGSSMSVLRLVGVHGERLAGELVTDLGEYRLLALTAEVELELTEQPAT
jgi:hypothetical protein